MTGLLSAARAGSAIGAIALWTVPGDVVFVNRADGVPALPHLEIGLVGGARTHSDKAIHCVRDEMRLALPT